MRQAEHHYEDSDGGRDVGSAPVLCTFGDAIAVEHGDKAGERLIVE